MFRNHKLVAALLASLLAFAFAPASPAYAQATSCIATTSAPVYVAGALVPQTCDLGGNLREVAKPYSGSGADWQVNLSLANTVQAPLKTAGGAGVKNYVTACQFAGVATTVATSVTLLDAATIIWSSNILAGQGFQEVAFPTPLHAIANDAINIVLGTSPVGAVAVNCQGYSASD